jgi:hypothetical protein
VPVVATVVVDVAEVVEVDAVVWARTKVVVGFPGAGEVVAGAVPAVVVALGSPCGSSPQPVAAAAAMTIATLTHRSQPLNVMVDTTGLLHLSNPTSAGSRRTWPFTPLE